MFQSTKCTGQILINPITCISLSKLAGNRDLKIAFRLDRELSWKTTAPKRRYDLSNILLKFTRWINSFPFTRYFVAEITLPAEHLFATASFSLVLK